MYNINIWSIVFTIISYHLLKLDEKEINFWIVNKIEAIEDNVDKWTREWNKILLFLHGR